MLSPKHKASLATAEAVGDELSFIVEVIAAVHPLASVTVKV